MLLTLLALCAPIACSRPVHMGDLYSANRREQVWGIAPFLNESGASSVNGLQIADAFMAETELVHGLKAVPVNRVLQAMRELDLRQIETHGDVLLVMNHLELDGFIVGSVTAYDPYRPMILGLAVELYRRDDPDQGTLDTRALTRAVGSEALPELAGPGGPVASASDLFDATNFRTLDLLDTYAAGRHDVDGALRTDRYLVSMRLYARFASYRLLKHMLEQEQARQMAVAGHTR